MDTSSAVSLASASTLTLLCPSPDVCKNITPHGEFWFPDGDLVLVAGNVGFRVYRGLLAAQSTVFSDMFSCASEDDDESFEGCPVVRLSDTPQELAYLLRILLPTAWQRPHSVGGMQKRSFEEVAAQARLSHKYHVQDVEGQALDLLRQRYPRSFDEWISGNRLKSIAGSPVHAIGAVNIARLTNTTSILPTALYICCNLGSDVLDGWNREDGRVEHLSTDDLKICVASRETLCREGARMFFKVFHDQPSTECASVDKCRTVLREMGQSLVKCCLSLVVECGALGSWRSIIESTRASSHGICDGCKMELLERDRKARTELWDKLPGIFSVSVPEWGKKGGNVAVDKLELYCLVSSSGPTSVMSADAGPLKRTHIDGDDPSVSFSTSPAISLQDLKRHDELWFDDGNLVLIARDTAFRIYRGLIASQSTVFSDMLVSSCASADETYDGCPTVHLSDSPQDLAHFLRILLPGSRKRFYSHDASTELSFDEVAAVIRIAHKYHVADIQHQALLFLRDFYFPSDFSRYEEHRKTSSASGKHGIAAINLARLTNTPSLLPLAFLQCNSLREAVLDGQKREDGTIEHLSPDDLRRCFAAQSALLERNSQVMAAVFDPIPSETCQDRESCNYGLHSSCSFLVHHKTIFKHDLIINWAKWIRAVGHGTSNERFICPECEKELLARNARGRRKFWADLPKIFGITVEGWGSSGAAN